MGMSIEMTCKDESYLHDLTVPSGRTITQCVKVALRLL